MLKSQAKYIKIMSLRDIDQIGFEFLEDLNKAVSA